MELLYYATKGKVDGIKSALDQGALIDCQTKKEKMAVTPLTIASSGGHTGAVDTLLKNGADPNALCQKGIHPPLEMAATQGHVEIMNIPLDYGGEVDIMNWNTSNTALMAASSNGHVPTVKLLLKHGADVNMKGEDEWTTLSNAARLYMS